MLKKLKQYLADGRLLSRRLGPNYNFCLVFGSTENFRWKPIWKLESWLCHKGDHAPNYYFSIRFPLPNGGMYNVEFEIMHNEHWCDIIKMRDPVTPYTGKYLDKNDYTLPKGF